MSTMTTVPVVSATWSEIDTDGKSEIVMQNVGSASVLVAVGQSAPQSATAPPEQLATPTISPPADSYTSDQSVTISGPAGATIRYTTDGSTPNAGSPAYSDPIALTVPSVTTVKAYATKAGYADSAVASAAFTLSAAAQSEAYVTWTSGNNVTTSGSYVQCNGSAGGAISIERIDPAQPFTFTYEIESGTASDGNVVSIDGNADTDYAWTPSQATLAGVYTYGGSLYQSGDGYAANNGVSLSLPAQVRFRKSGDDIQIDYSTDSGGSWTPYVTRVGVLAGKTSLNVKALFAVPSSQKRVKVKASAEFAKWRMGGGVVLAGLVRRRGAEAALFARGVALQRETTANDKAALAAWAVTSRAA